MADIEHICLLIDGDELSGVRLPGGRAGSESDVRRWRFATGDAPSSTESPLIEGPAVDAASSPDSAEQETISKEPAGTGGLKSLAEAFRSAASELKIAEGAVLVLPSDILISRVISVPVSDTESIDSMVRLKMEKLSPVSGEELEVAWEIVSADETSTRVFAVAMPISKLDTIAEAISPSGIMLARIDSSVLSQWELFRRSPLSAECIPAVEGEVRAFLFRQPSGCVDFLLADSSGPLFARSFSAPDDAGEFVREVYLSLLDYASESGAVTPSSLTYISRSAPDAEVQAKLTEVLETSVNWFDSSRLGPYILGAVMRDNGENRLDIIPPSWRELERQAESRGKFTRAIVAALAVWVLLFAAYLVVPRYFDRKIAAVNASIARVTPAYNAVFDIRSKVRIISSYEDRSKSAIDILRLLCTEMPEGMTFSLLRYEKGFNDGKQKKTGGLKISGEAPPPGESVMLFKDALDKTALFSQVTINNQILDGKRQRTRFEIDARFREEEAAQ